MRWRHITAVAALGLVSACGATTGGHGSTGDMSGMSMGKDGAMPGPGGGTSLDAALKSQVRNLPLVDQHGTRFTLASLTGKPVVLTDFLTTCQEICPLTTVNLHRLAAANPGVEFLEGTVDPQRDDVHRLAAYEKLYGALPNLRYFSAGSGTAELWKALGISYDKVPSEKPLPTDWLTGKKLTYDVDHSDVLYILGSDGHERWLTSGSPNTQGAAPPSRMMRYLSGQGQHNLHHPGQFTWTATQVQTALKALVTKGS